MKEKRSKHMAWLWNQFTCQKCGRCCRKTRLPWDPDRLTDIAEFLGISREEVVNKYYGRVVEANDQKMIEWADEKRTPCPFLQLDNTCKIYTVRPTECRLYPVETDCGRQGIDCLGLTISE
jgi:Fe-S-cluster containining protein